MVSTGGGASQLEDTTFCDGKVHFDLKEGVYIAPTWQYLLGTA